ncbi:MAG: class I SAM-dependent methyltransferase [Candidatus Bipolaricaulia bacterium]
MTPTFGRREELFDRWAARYDEAVGSADGFPFAGYQATLDRVAALANAEPGHSVLDLGIGTGNLACRLVDRGCEVWGVDISPKMLVLAQAKLPSVRLAHGDIAEGWPPELPNRFDRIVSAYVFHHFDLPTKVKLLVWLLSEHCVEGGQVVIGDVSFATGRALRDAKRVWSRRFDPEEHYWVAEDSAAACEEAGMTTTYEESSPCAGIYVVRLRSCEPRRTLEGDPAPSADLGFSYRVTKGGVVFIRRGGRTVTELRSDVARRFVVEVEGAEEADAQETMARYTGNYKRGNERLADRHPRRRG